MRHDASSYRGQAGDIVVLCLRFETWVNVICLVLYVLFVTFVSTVVAGAATYLNMERAGGLLFVAIWAFAGCYLFSYLTIAGYHGHGGKMLATYTLKNHSVGQQAVRQVIALLAWEAVWIGLLFFLLKGMSSSGSAVSSVGSTFGLGAAGGAIGIMVALQIFVVLMILIGVPVSGIVACKTSSPREVVTWSPWSWLFERREHLAIFFVNLLGGSVVFAAIYLFPFLVLVSVLAGVAPRLSLFVSSWIFAFPALVAPFLAGGLAGALVRADEAIGRESEPDGAPRPETGVAQGGEAVTEARPKSVGSPVFAPLEDDYPPSDLVQAVKRQAEAIPEILRALALTSRDSFDRPTITVAFEIHPDTKLARRGQIVKALSAGLEQQARVVIVGETNRSAIEGVGLLCYAKAD